MSKLRYKIKVVIKSNTYIRGSGLYVIEICRMKLLSDLRIHLGYYVCRIAIILTISHLLDEYKGVCFFLSLSVCHYRNQCSQIHVHSGRNVVIKVVFPAACTDCFD